VRFVVALRNQDFTRCRGLSDHLKKSEAADIVKIASAASAKDSLIAQIYDEALRNRAVLAGGSLALLVLVFWGT
jgi:hypothetical protein